MMHPYVSTLSRQMPYVQNLSDQSCGVRSTRREIPLTRSGRNPLQTQLATGVQPNYVNSVSAAIRPCIPNSTRKHAGLTAALFTRCGSSGLSIQSRSARSRKESPDSTRNAPTRMFRRRTLFFPTFGTIPSDPESITRRNRTRELHHHGFVVQEGFCTALLGKPSYLI